MGRDRERVEVDPARLDYRGGDIGGSYSGDTIAEPRGRSSVRHPFAYAGYEYVMTGGTFGPGLYAEVEAYRIVPLQAYQGITKRYTDGDYEDWRQSPDGFYHGMIVRRGKEECVLVGPPLRFVAGEPVGEQLSMF